MSAAMEIAQKAADAAAKQRLEKTVEYWGVVRRCAREDGDPDPDEIASFLVAGDHDPAKFQEHVEVVAARFRAVRRMEEAAKLEREVAELEARHRAELERFEPIIKAHEALCRELRDAKEARRAEILAAKGEHARVFSLDRCPYRHLLDALEPLRERAREARARVDQQREHVNKLEYWLRERTLLTHEERVKWGHERQRAERELPGRREALARCESELAKVQAELAKVELGLREP